MPEHELVISTEAGLYCPEGNFHLDPWLPVARALITHAHSDHARSGCGRYVTVRPGKALLQARLGPDAVIDAIDYGEPLVINGVRISFHPAGHLLGSAQIRIESRGEVCVFSGDYKVAADPTCAPFEPLKCDTFITESTFGLPLFRWRPPAEVFSEMNLWWQANATQRRASVIYAYSLGKAQRLLSGLDPSIGPIFCHGAVHRMTEIYRQQGVSLPAAAYVGDRGPKEDWSRALIVAPPRARGSAWLRRFGDFGSANASGWMQIRGARRRLAVDRGFVLSDHADWPGLLEAIAGTRARRIRVTHGAVGPMVRWLSENGWDASAIATRYEGEQEQQADLAEGESIEAEAPQSADVTESPETS